MDTSIVANSMGYVFIGVVFSIFLFGIVVCQTFIYFHRYKNDQIWMKLFIAFLIFADSLHSVFILAFVYQKLIRHFGDFESIQWSNWLFNSYPALVGIIATCVQFFFAYRIKILTESMSLFVLVMILATPQAFGGLTFSIEAARIKEFARFPEFRPVVIAWTATSTICEVFITVLLTWTLRKYRSRRLYVTDDIVKRVMRMTLQNGCITTVWTMIDFLIVASSTSLAHFMFCFPLAKLYLVSMLSTLNDRPTRDPQSALNATLVDPNSTEYSHVRKESRDSVQAMPESRIPAVTFGNSSTGGGHRPSLPSIPEPSVTSTIVDESHSYRDWYYGDNSQSSLREKGILSVPPTPLIVTEY